MTTIHAAMCAVREDLRACLVERETTIDNALLALLTREHHCQFGPPGSGKSMLVRALCARIEGAQYFEKAMSPVTTPEDLYGPIDLIRLADHGEWVRRDTGSMTQAHIVFLDEITRVNKALEDTLLVAMNERLQQVVGFAPAPLPLVSLFSAANHPFDEASAAFNDRFLLREYVDPVREDANFTRLFCGQLPDWRDVHARCTFAQVTQAQADVATVQGTAEVLQAVHALRQQLDEQGIVVSMRRWAQCGKLLKARAWLDGLSTMDLEGMAVLAHALWQTPQERATVQRCVYALATPLTLTAVEMQDQATDLVAKLPPEDSRDWAPKADNALLQLNDMVQTLHDALARTSLRDTSRATTALAHIAAHHKRIATRLFADISRLQLAL